MFDYDAGGIFLIFLIGTIVSIIEILIGTIIWNTLMPYLFNFPRVSFFQLCGLVYLIRMAFPTIRHNKN